MRKALIGSLIAVLVVVIVAGAFAQGRQPGQGRGQRGQMPSMMTAIVAEGKIFSIKDGVLYKINATSMEVEKKKKLELDEGEGETGRFLARLRLSMHVEGKNLFLMGYNVIYKINIDSLELAGTLKADDLTPPEEEKEEESKEE